MHPRVARPRIGIDRALGSPSVLPKEDTSDRPLTSSLHGAGATTVLARAIGVQSSARAARSHERATGVSEARSYEATSANTRGQTVRSGGSGRRRRETSCPSIHRAPGLIPRGREIGREPRARVQVDRLVGWQKSVGHIAICVGRSQPGGSHEDADACSRWRQGEPVCHAFHGTLQIREKQTT